MRIQPNLDRLGEVFGSVSFTRQGLVAAGKAR